MFETILKYVPPPEAVDIEGALQLQTAALGYSSYVGRIGGKHVQRGKLRSAQQVTVMYGQPDADGKVRAWCAEKCQGQSNLRFQRN